jgi:hypothetical protein
MQQNQWKSRIVGYGEEAPDQLLANPQNFRIHPQTQQKALKAAISEVGFIAPVLVNRTTNRVLDGHLRVALAISEDQETIPVAYLELTEEEEAIALASLDPITGLAVNDKELLKTLIDSIETENQELIDLWDAMLPAASEPDEDESEAADEEKDNGYIIQYNIVFVNEHEQQVWFDFLKKLKATYPGSTEHSTRIIRWISESGVLDV